jgi:cell wall-associated NlpC family hydrolase
MVMKHFLIILFFSLSIVGKSNVSFEVPKDGIQIDSLISFCKKQLGTHYLYASCDPQSGFDCSGFVYYVFNHFNIKVPRSSVDYINVGKTIHPDSFKVGDVIVFTGTNSKIRKPGHVGIILSSYGNELKFIHSSSNKKDSGVKISNYTNSDNYKKRFLKIVRVTRVYK